MNCSDYCMDTLYSNGTIARNSCTNYCLFEGVSKGTLSHCPSSVDPFAISCCMSSAVTLDSNCITSSHPLNGIQSLLFEGVSAGFTLLIAMMIFGLYVF